MPKLECEVKTVVCSGMIVRKLTGKKKDDPVFNCCCACRAYLSRTGVKLKEAKS